jgi:hypothetical protein
MHTGVAPVCCFTGTRSIDRIVIPYLCDCCPICAEAMHPDISQSAAAMPVAATVAVISAVPVVAAVANCQRPGAAAVADCLCSSGSGGDACGGDGGGDSGGACGCGCGELQIAGEAAAVGCGGGDANRRSWAQIKPRDSLRSKRGAAR